MVSVIICAHNPRPDYFARVLTALAAQTLSANAWELVLIDNASVPPLFPGIMSTSPPNARLVREETLGLTPARLRGIRESQGEVLVFVDDDNVLDLNYLETVVKMTQTHPEMGAWGASIRGEFEFPPPETIKPYLPGLAIGEIDRDSRSNRAIWSSAVPYGAGLCVRRQVADYYAQQVAANPLRQALDRSGQTLGSGGDMDIAFCAADLGMSYGRICALRLTHLIPRERLEWDYIVRLYSGFAFSDELIAALRGSPAGRSLRRLVVTIKFWLQYGLHANAARRTLLAAMWRSKRAARRLLTDKRQGRISPEIDDLRPLPEDGFVGASNPVRTQGMRPGFARLGDNVETGFEKPLSWDAVRRTTEVRGYPIARLETELSEQVAENQRLRGELEATVSRLKQLELSLMEATYQEELKRKELNSVYASTSWRISAPIRWVGRLANPKKRLGLRRLIAVAGQAAISKQSTATLGRGQSQTPTAAGSTPGGQSVFPQFVKRHETAVILHLFYPDLWPECEALLACLDGKFDLCVTIPSVVEFPNERVTRKYPQASIYRCENRGRDIAPFLAAFTRIFPFQYRYLCKIHAKKSTYLEDGNDWRQDMFAQLLGSREQVALAKQAFDSNPALGILAPKGYVVSSDFYGKANLRKVALLAERAGVPWDNSPFAFVAGSMFWFRPDALARLISLPISGRDFEAEQGQVDGTLAHAFERFFGLLAARSGFRLAELSARGATVLSEASAIPSNNPQ